jgi:hypothetical protein
MKKLILFSLLCLVSVSAFALADYDPFNYTVGANLMGQTDSTDGQVWYQAGANTTLTTQPTISSGSLSISGLAASSGNSITFGGATGTGNGARVDYSGGPVSSGTLYYSFALDITSIASLTTATSGIFFAAFNNGTGSSTTVPSVIGAGLLAYKLTSTTFNLGIKLGAGGAVDDSGGSFTTGSTIFIVGSYTYGTGGGNDTANLWINPSSSTFGGTAPTATVTSSGSSATGINGNAISSFVFFDRSTAEPNSMIADELRIGTSYADVTPTPEVVPEPTSLAVGGLGIAALIAVRRFRRK